MRTGRRVFGFGRGAFNPAISDGKRLYITGYSSQYAFEPREAEASRSKTERRRSATARKRRERGGEPARARATSPSSVQVIGSSRNAA